jgi:hypothetical protein
VQRYNYFRFECRYFHFRCRLTPDNVGNGPSQSPVPENMGGAAGISQIPQLVSELYILPVFQPPYWIFRRETMSLYTALCAARPLFLRNIIITSKNSLVDCFYSDLLEVPVLWPPSWISGGRVHPGKSPYTPLDSSSPKMWG